MKWLYIRYSFQLLSLAVCTFPLHSGTTATKIFSLFERLFMSILFSFNSKWRYALFDEKHAYKCRKQGVGCILTLWEFSCFIHFIVLYIRYRHVYTFGLKRSKYSKIRVFNRSVEHTKPIKYHSNIHNEIYNICHD